MMDDEVYPVTMRFSWSEQVVTAPGLSTVGSSRNPVGFMGDTISQLLLAINSVLLWNILIAIVVGIPFALLVIKILHGDFWPGRLLQQYREGKREAANDDDSNE